MPITPPAAIEPRPLRVTLSLDAQLTAFRRNPFLAMPITGAAVWLLLAGAGAWLPASPAALAVFGGTGMIFYLALLVARWTGEDLLGRRRRGNFFDRVFLLSVAMSLGVFAIAIPFARADLTSVPLSVGVLTGLMWLPFSALLGHWVGYFHAITRTGLLLAAWYLFPDQRFVVLPLIIVGVYVVTLVALVHRWRTTAR